MQQLVKASVLLWSLFVAGPLVAEVVEWKSPPRMVGAYLSITFDDATQSQYQAGFPLLQQAQLPATLFVPTEPVDANDPFYMTWEEIRQLHRTGWEIGSHAVTHTALTTLDQISLVGELALSAQRITDEVGVPPQTIASPYGDYDARVLDEVRRFYALHVRAWGDNNGINQPHVDPYLIERVNIDDTLTADEVCRKVREVEDGQWLVLMLHQVALPSGPYHTSPGVLQNIVSCIETQMYEYDLTVGTVSAIGKIFTK